MDYHLNKGDMKSVVYCVDRGMKKGKSHARIWLPPPNVVKSIMQYFEDKKDVNGAEKFIEVLKTVQPELPTEVFEALIRTYAASGKTSPGMRLRLKMENATVNEATEKLLDQVCAE
ncbi:hypothetical protein J5N97_016540 [Dioscorea zingiberensis]|uniref:Pentatricopeptide repeat-containing protein n=1 Tax=Dioscorea zingiberensis TaxID=325984 RepID=A0A9D5CLY5_9LILI|nr:hypothetical protein J5N97_016540 [Dioscorea zingiberensis]